MAKYVHPSPEKGIVRIRGVKFVDGVTAEVTVSETTAEYFKKIGITAQKSRQSRQAEPEESKEK